MPRYSSLNLCLDAVKYNLRFNLLPYILAGLFVLIFTPVMFGIVALEADAVGYPLELCLPVIGIILLTPIYSFELDAGILDTIRARRTPHVFICVLRMFIMTALIFIMICAFVFAMYEMESDVMSMHALASFSNAVFLGGMGILSASLSGSPVIGYMVPIFYYVLDLMGGLGRSFTIFSIMRTGEINYKPALFIAGMLFLSVSAVCFKLRTKIR